MSWRYQYVAEYSGLQDEFHVQRLGEALLTNRTRITQKDGSNDWVPFAIGDFPTVPRAIDEVRKAHQLVKRPKGRQRA